MRLFVVAFLVFVVGAAVGHPLEEAPDSAFKVLSRNERSPQGGDDSAKSTDKCNEVQLSEFFSDHDACYKRADRELLEAIGADIADGFCRSIIKKVECINTQAPRCFDDEKVVDVRMGFLRRKYQQVENNTLLSNSDILFTCPAFRNFKTDYVKFVTGSTFCTFEDYFRRKGEWETCNNQTRELRDSTVQLARLLSNGRELFLQAFCTARNDWDNKCNPIITKCLAKKEKQKLLDSDLKAYIKLERELIEAGFNDFSWTETCDIYDSGSDDDNRLSSLPDFRRSRN